MQCFRAWPNRREKQLDKHRHFQHEAREVGMHPRQVLKGIGGAVPVVELSA